MATTPRHGLPYVYVSWLTKLLAGDTQCLYQPWLKSHFKYDKRPERSFDRAAWTNDHNRLVAARAEALRSEGWTVTLEDQNAFRLSGRGAILAGKPDLVAVRDKVTLIVDGKTGRPSSADWWQVLIYMLVLPQISAGDGITDVRGEVAYRDHVIAIEPEELTPVIAQQIYALIRSVSAGRQATTPSQKDCAWCDIADCTDRFVESTDPILTSEF